MLQVREYSNEVLNWDLNNVSFHVSMLDNKSIIVYLDVWTSEMCHFIFRKRSIRYPKRDLEMAGWSKQTESLNISE